MISEQTKPSLHQLAQLGQAVWLDYIRRSFITSGELQREIDAGLRGITANPTILEKAIAGSSDYDESINKLAAAGKSTREIYEALAFQDIGMAADMFRPLYDATGGHDGFVSLEVDPELAHDTEATKAQARYLFYALARPNVMIKVPATDEGLPVIRQLIGEGININITLMFSQEQYLAVAEAYLAGLEEYAGANGDLSKVASVASFFISRVDSMIDRALEENGSPEALALRGKIAVANAKVTYQLFREKFAGTRWEGLAAQGARVQRPLWASTSTKNPQYPDLLYVDNLIGPETVNTMPQSTLEAFRDHGVVKNTITEGLEEARAQLAQLAELGIDLDEITHKLTEDGIEQFAKSFDALMASIEEKRKRVVAGERAAEGQLVKYQSAVDAALSEMREQRIMARIWAHDYTVWKPEPTEITNRLGWLHSHEVMAEALPEISKLVEEVQAAGYTHALLLGMGGSSLAPEVFRKTFGVAAGYLDLAVLDSTDPGAVAAAAARSDPAKTLYIVSTKSGGTIETFSFFKYFYNYVRDKVGPDKVGKHFIAITDPGSELYDVAQKYGFRRTFLNDPNIGGRYSALSYFGLVPAMLLGIDAAKLLDRAAAMACNSEECNKPEATNNVGAWLGAALGELAKVGEDKVTFIISPQLVPFGAWVEQLIAESLGKEGKGVVPVVDEPVGVPEVYGGDRFFVYLRLEGDSTYDSAVQVLKEAGHPIVQLKLHDQYDLGGEFFRWEIATAVAGYRLAINPFDQPNVESAKKVARKMLEIYQHEGKLPKLTKTFDATGITGCSDSSGETLAEVVDAILAEALPGDYVAIQAYVQPTAETDAALQELRTKLRDKLKLAVTVGYGPRFLHSTGQLHKGDAGNGLFLQITADSPQDLPIPNEPDSWESMLSFEVLKEAQALGDRQALLEKERRLICFHLDRNVVARLEQLAELI